MNNDQNNNPTEQPKEITFWQAFGDFCYFEMLPFLILFTMAFTTLAAKFDYEFACKVGFYIIAGLSVFYIAFPNKEKGV